MGPVPFLTLCDASVCVYFYGIQCNPFVGKIERGYRSSTMTKHVYVILLSTFVFGFVTGAILFLYNNTGNGEDGEPVLLEGEAAISVTAYRYGGCARGDGCASYRIADDGTYEYIVRSRAEGETRFADTLNSAEKTALFKTLKDTNLESLLETAFTGTCPVEYDGTGYRYNVTYYDKHYAFDTCVQDLENEPLFITLADYFEMFSNTYTIPE